MHQLLDRFSNISKLLCVSNANEIVLLLEENLPDNNSFAVVEIDTQNNIHIDGFYNCEDKDLNRFTV